MRILRTLQIILAGSLALSLVHSIGCGGGSASIGSAPIVSTPATRAVTIEGRALINTVTRAAVNPQITDSVTVSNTPVLNDAPIQNAPAEVVLVTETGTLGNVLATATTDSNGYFSFGSVTVPSDTARFLIRVTHNGQSVSRFLPVANSTVEPLRIDLSTTVATGYLLEQILANPALLANDLSDSMDSYIAKFDELRRNGTAANVDTLLNPTEHAAAIAQLKGIIEPAKPTEPTQPEIPKPTEPTPAEPQKPATGSVEIITRGK